MRLSGSHLVSLAILAGIGGWMFTGDLIQGGIENPNAKTIAEREAGRTSEAFRVRVTTIQPTERPSNLDIRGRTKADAVVSVRAETGGTVQERPVKKGDFVKAGDLLCVLDAGVRGTSLAQAKAQLVQAEEDFKANEQLVARGFATRSRLRQLQAAMDAAKAAVASAEQEVSRTEIRATAAGLVQEPLAEVGDNLASGGLCLTIMQPDPMLFTGQVSERDVASLSTGMSADVKLISGESVEGKLRFISPAADAQTRTFNVEIELPNSSMTIRDGLTASAVIPLAATSAYEISASWLTLADDGEVGVRAVDSENKVKFYPVKILSQNESTMWVSGLEPNLKLITLGQNFVAQGEVVAPMTADQIKALEQAAAQSEAEAAKPAVDTKVDTNS